MKDLKTSATWRKRPLIVNVTKDGITIGPEGLTANVLSWEDVWEMVLGVEEKAYEGWSLIAKGKYLIQTGIKKLDFGEEGVSVGLLDEAVLNLNAAMWRER
jgi:hypothetical protein